MYFNILYVTESVTSHENQEATLALTALFSPEQHALLLGSIYMIQSIFLGMYMYVLVHEKRNEDIFRSTKTLGWFGPTAD